MTDTKCTQPGELRMPAEWERQAATWLAWPHNPETWPHNLAEARLEFRALVLALADSQQVHIIAAPDQLPLARQCIGTHPRVEWFPIPTNDAWLRDTGPTFVVDTSRNELVGIGWHYNAWGGKYPPFDLDQQVARRICDSLEIDCLPSQLCFEGGALDVDGRGTILSTTSCALDPHRNPDWSEARVAAELVRRLGGESVIWLPGDALTGDDTDGHIDQLARFISEREIVYAWTDNVDDPQYRGLKANRDRLQAAIGSLDQAIKLTPLPLPAPASLHGRHLPASYCNFLIANELVIVPQFEDGADALAVELLQSRYPDREVIGLSSRHLAVGLGSFHCLSQQQPAIPG